MSAAALDEAAGLGKSHVSDYLSGRKDRLSDDVLELIADVLNTTPQWLLTASGPETRDALTRQRVSASDVLHIDRANIMGVGKRDNREIKIISMNLMSGDCELADKAASGLHRGVIVDPDIFLPGNAYAMAMATHNQISVLVKRVTMKSGDDIWFITDTA